MKKICIFGAGAVGGHMAAYLARAGLEVSVVARGPHLAAIRESGLTLVGQDETFTVKVAASDRPADLGPQDLVISTLKAQALSATAASFVPLLTDDTPVIFAVNGIPWWYFHGLADDASSRLPRLDPEGGLWRHIGAARALGCVIRSPNEITSPGVVRAAGKANTFTIGEPDGSDSLRLKTVVNTLKQGLAGARASTQIRSDIWAKLALNVPSSLLACLTTSTAPDLFANPETRALYQRLGEETGRVAAAYDAHANFDIDKQIQATGQTRHPPSMLQDLLAGRPIELDAQMRAVQDLGRLANVSTPTLDIMVALLDQRARARA